MASAGSSTDGSLGGTGAVPDPRPGWLRALVAVGILLLLLIGFPTLALGALLVADPDGPFLLTLGLLLSALGVAGLVRELGDVRHRRNPPSARLEERDAAAALFLPRAATPSLVSAWSLVAVAVTCLLGAGFAVAASRWVLAGLLLAAGVVALGVSQPHRARQLAGGLWFTPDRVVHEHDGVGWELVWEDVAGAVPQEPMPVLVRGGRLPEIRRGPAWGRHRGRAVVDGVLVVETRYLAGGAGLAAYVIEKAVADPAFRAALGRRESLPPS